MDRLLFKKNNPGVVVVCRAFLFLLIFTADSFSWPPSLSAVATITPTASPTATATATATTTVSATAHDSNLSAISSSLLSSLTTVITTWAFVALCVLVILRRKLPDFLDELTAAMRDRAIAIQVAGVNVQVAEPAIEVPQEQPRLFSRSPFEIDPEPIIEGSKVLTELTPQIQLPVTDYVARYWANGAGLKLAEEMRVARTELGSQSSQAKPVWERLIAYCKALQSARFLEAAAMLGLRASNKDLSDEIDRINRKKPGTLDSDECLVLHCLGVAYAQTGSWNEADATLTRLRIPDGALSYLPAADTLLSCRYNDFILKAKEKDTIDAATFVEDVRQGYIIPGEKQRNELADDELWNSFSEYSSNISYYRREFLKVLGAMNAMIGEHCNVAAAKDDLLRKAKEHFQSCCKPIDPGPEQPTFLDQNNLADLYTKMKDYPAAHRLLNEALKARIPPYAIVCATHAEVLWKENEPGKALRELEKYTVDDAQSASAEEMNQYVCNQIFAAKLVLADPKLGRSHLPMASQILEEARQFVNLHRNTLDENDSRDRETEICELLAFAYLQMPGNERRAVEMFGELENLSPESGSPYERWTRKVGLAKACVRLATSERSSFNRGGALALRDRVDSILKETRQKLNDFPLDQRGPLQRLDRYFRLHLDTVIVNQELAEESFYQTRISAASDIIDQLIEPELEALSDCLKNPSGLKQKLGAEASRIETRLSLYRARRYFLKGQIAMQSDSSVTNEKIAEVNQIFASARGINDALDCRVELAFGAMLLSAAMTRKGDDAIDLYGRAINSLEAAAGRDVPALRAETMRQLIDAYRRRDLVLRTTRRSQIKA